ncbi:unnamed protein product [Parnassius apollo]|uniref:(apollo) hypothetical protein n=1 Tax=Parnassius apollo TaxID=110799 RepID=A0A8S3WRL4_PARAO|nr:unnamed protein product [Parnassius apollo]
MNNENGRRQSIFEKTERATSTGKLYKEHGKREKRCRKRHLDEEERKLGQRELLAVASTSTTNNLEPPQDLDKERILNSEVSLPEILCAEISSKRGRKNPISSKLVTDLHGCRHKQILDPANLY